MQLLKKLLFIFNLVCAGSSLLRGLFLQLQRVGLLSSCGAQASHCCGFSCCGAWTLGRWASVVAMCRLSSCGSQALEHRLSGCSTQAQQLHHRQDLLDQGSNPCLLHWQADSFLLSYQGSPYLCSFLHFSFFFFPLLLRLIHIVACANTLFLFLLSGIPLCR